MRPYILGLLALLIIWLLVVRPLRGQTPRWISAALCAAILIPGAIYELHWQHTEQVGSQIVREVSGKKTGYLYCERLTGAMLDASARAGEVRSDEPNKAFITWSTCEDFASFIDSDKQQPSLKQVIALHVVIHEAVHVSGEYNEAITECRAMAKTVGIAEGLGVNAPVAESMAQRYKTEVYPELSDDYHMQCEPDT